MEKRYLWKLRNREIVLGERTLLMGVLNVTPDSFSDGGNYLDPDRAYARALELEAEGADIIDIGAESTKPGSQRVPEGEELRRLVPVLKRLKGQLQIPISVDTYKSAVAERALEHGVEIINDPSGNLWDLSLPRVVNQYNAGLILNHMRGTPETWAHLGPIKHLMKSIAIDLDAAINRVRQAGVQKAQIIIDPGLGFGKRREQNAEIIAQLEELRSFDLPLAIGPSRKSFLKIEESQDAELATAAAVTACIMKGAHIVRVHDVKRMKQVSEIADSIRFAYREESEPRDTPRPRPSRLSGPSEGPDTPGGKKLASRVPLRRSSGERSGQEGSGPARPRREDRPARAPQDRWQRGQ